MARTVKRFTMLPAAALVLAAASLAIVLGWPPLPTGIWPGITLGLFAVLAGILALKSPPRSRAARRTAWAGVGLGLVASCLGVLVYLGLILAAGRLG